MTEPISGVSRPAPDAARLHRTIWLPFWSAAFLCAVALVSSVFGARAAAVNVPFFSFLPMAFWFGCATQRASERLWRLEQQLGAGDR